MNRYTKTIKSGATLIEAIIVVGIFSFIGYAFAQTAALGSVHIADSRTRIAAVAVANAQMEQLRNLSYDMVAVIGGVPAGTIDPDVTVNHNGRNFRVQTDIRYVDDPFDGTAISTPMDLIPTDYKNVRIDVSWDDATAARRVRLESRFVPPGIEQSTGGGTLVINILDADGQPVTDAVVTVTNTTLVPHVSLAAWSDAAGSVVIPGAPAGEGYAITATKDGYESVITYPPYPVTTFYPTDEHVTVIEATVTAKSLVVGALTDVTMTLRNPAGEMMAGVPVRIVGGRIIGTTPQSTPVYDTDVTNVANQEGTVDLGMLSPGTYTMTVTDSAYRLITVDDASTTDATVFALAQGGSHTFVATVAPMTTPSFLFHVRESDTNTPLSGATIRVTANEPIYDVTITTDAYGYAYVPNDPETPLTQGVSYGVAVAATGHEEQEGNFVATSGLTDVHFTLEATP